MNDSWSRESCPRCSASNWFCYGDLEDCTSVIGEEEAHQCHKCAFRWWIEGMGDIEKEHAFETSGWNGEYATIEAWFNSADMHVLKGQREPT